MHISKGAILGEAGLPPNLMLIKNASLILIPKRPLLETIVSKPKNVTLKMEKGVVLFKFKREEKRLITILYFPLVKFNLA